MILLMTASLIVVLLISVWIHGDAALGAPYIRFLSRGVIFGIAGAIVLPTVAAFLAGVALLVFVGLRRCWPQASLMSRWLRTRPWKLIGACAGLMGFLAGTGGNCLLTAYLTGFDEEIYQLADESRRLAGFRELDYPGFPPIVLRRTTNEGYVRREPLVILPPKLMNLGRAGEDERQGYRLSSEDPRAIVRAIVRTYQGVRQGGSTIAQQLAGLLFELKPQGEGKWKTKFQKYLLGMRVDDLLERDEMLLLYLNIVPVGAIGGIEISGVQAAALTFYNKSVTELTVAQFASIMARIPNPQCFSPYRAAGERDRFCKDGFGNFRKNQERIVKRAVHLRFITSEEYVKASGEMLLGLQPQNEAVRSLRRPRLSAVMAEIDRRLPNDTRFVRAYMATNQREQQLLQQAIREARPAITSLPGIKHGERILIEAVVIGPGGTIISEFGNTVSAGGASSFIKPFVAAAGLTDHVVHTSRDNIPGMRLSVATMLFKSVNEGSERLCMEMEPARVASYLRTMGFEIPRNRISVKNCIGAGAVISPRAAVAAFAVFNYSSPGTLYEPRLVERIADGWTGRSIFSTDGIQVMPTGVALEVRRALEQTPLQGTGTLCRDLAKVGSIAMKTGTAAFHSRKLRRVIGEGGSWTLAADSVSKTVIAVRIRYASGHPFVPNGGVSAIRVVQRYLEAKRKEAIL